MTSWTLTPIDQIVVCDGVSAREFDGEWVLLDLSGGNYFGLDEIGGSVWREISNGKSAKQVAALLKQKYEVSEDELLRDIMQFLNELLDRKLVRVSAVSRAGEP